MTPSQKWLLLLDAILLVLYKNANLPIFLTLILMAICNIVSLSVVGKDVSLIVYLDTKYLNTQAFWKVKCLSLYKSNVFFVQVKCCLCTSQILSLYKSMLSLYKSNFVFVQVNVVFVKSISISISNRLKFPTRRVQLNPINLN